MVTSRLTAPAVASAGTTASQEFREALAALPREFEIREDFPAEALEELAAVLRAHAAGENAPEWDARDLEFVTIDPASSTDLDQAVQMERREGGYTVRYAIADVPSFVALGGALDAETRLRGQTVYLPDRRIGLHPEEMAEDAGSLLPGQDRWAYVFTFELAEDASVTSMDLRRGIVRSREKLSYIGVQEDLDSAQPSERAELFREIGLKRIELERSRGGASLNLPEQEVSVTEGGTLEITSRAPLPSENYNAQISLMTGMETAKLFLAHNLGILRTMPAPDERSLREFRTRAAALGHPWEEDIDYGEFLRQLDTTDPHQLAVMHAAGSLFRGAGYLALPAASEDGTPVEPDEKALAQAAIGAPYTHTTAPLRRLVDRFVLLTAEHLANGRPLPEDLRQALPLLPELMKSSNQRTGQIERAAVDLVEAAVLAPHIGERFEAHVISSEGGKAKIQLTDPAVVARVSTDAAPGERIEVTLVSANLASRTAVFEADAAAAPAAGSTAVEPPRS